MNSFIIYICYVGNADRAVELLSRLQEALGRIGLEVNESKTRVFYPDLEEEIQKDGDWPQSFPETLKGFIKADTQGK